jgi:hypothetical protein
MTAMTMTTAAMTTTTRQRLIDNIVSSWHFKLSSWHFKPFSLSLTPQRDPIPLNF